jgi:hypothetical protein
MENIMKTLKDAAYDVEDELIKSFQEELDWRVRMDTFVADKYTQITMPWSGWMDAPKAQEIRDWCRTNLTDHFLGRGPDWLFKNEKDAILFKLRWYGQEH